MYEKFKRSEWFRHDRFGMFIHWGLYAIPARGEWVRSHEKLSIESYQPFFEEFNPVDFHAEDWANLAKAAGMKYAVLTAKHHDGFCLFDSKLTDYKSTNTPCGRDLVREFLDAFRKAGLKVGLYYSLLDWHHPAYPAYGDGRHPMTDNPAFKDREPFETYIAYLHGQVRELCENYGKIDIMWFDFSYESMSGETWEATKLVNMVRSLQPDILLDNRLEASGSGFGSIIDQNPKITSGDFASPEQIIPPQGLCNTLGEPIPWEACITLNGNWGYCATDFNYKTPDMIIKKLVECVSKGGNLLLNVGPNARGMIPKESIQILKTVGEWMTENHDSIYGCGNCSLPKPEWGRYTAKNGKIYAHILDIPIGFVPLTGIPKGQICKLRLLRDGSELYIQDNWIVNNYPDITFTSIQPYCAYDKTDTVIEITLK